MRRPILSIIIGTTLLWSLSFLSLNLINRTGITDPVTIMNIGASIAGLILFFSSVVSGNIASNNGWFYGLLIGIQWLIIPFGAGLQFIVMLIIWYFKGAIWTGGDYTDVLNKVIFPFIYSALSGTLGGILGGLLGEFLRKHNLSIIK